MKIKLKIFFHKLKKRMKKLVLKLRKMKINKLKKTQINKKKCYKILFK